MVRVQFTAKVSPWNVGEIASFDDAKALELVGRGIAVMVDVAASKVETVIDETPVDRMIRRGRPRSL